MSRRQNRLQVESLETRRLLAVDLLANIDIKADANFVPRDISVYKGLVLLRGNDGVTGAEPWITNGTAEGTRQLKDIWIGERGSGARDFTEYNDKLYFGANSGTLGLELWVTEGTPGTTRLIADIWPGTEPSAPTSLTVYKDHLYFFANDGTTGRELYRSDGTPGGTELVADSLEGRSGSSGDNMLVVGDQMFFESDTIAEGLAGIWVSDGTAEGTKPVSISGVNGSDIDFMQPFGDRLLFSSAGKLWLTDGTTDGSQQIQPSGDVLGSEFDQVFVAEGKIYVVDQLGLHEISSSLETNQQIASDAHGAIASGGKIYHWDADGFYVVNADPSSSRLVRFESFFGGEMGTAHAVDGGVVFAARRILDEFDIYVTDGTVDGTRVLETVTDKSAEPFADIQQIGNLIYFTATNGNFHESVWTIPAPVINVVDPGIPGDVNQDEFVNSLDIDAIYQAVGEGSTAEIYDLNADGNVNNADVDFLIEDILQTRRGDADLNRQIDFADFLRLSTSFGNLTAAWSDGDFDGDGEVSFADFLLLSTNFGFASGE